MREQYRCIRFNLYDIYKNTIIHDLVDEIKLSFFHRANCKIHTEEYKRSQNNMFVVIEVFGDTNYIEQAIKESQYFFSKKCKESNHEVWTQYN